MVPEVKSRAVLLNVLLCFLCGSFM